MGAAMKKVVFILVAFTFIVVAMLDCSSPNCPAVPLHCLCGVDPICVSGGWICQCPDASGQDASLDVGMDVATDVSSHDVSSDVASEAEASVDGASDAPSDGSLDAADACSGTCFDLKQDCAETDVDCGGPVCVPCIKGKHCLVNSDCISNMCIGYVCQ